MKRVFSIVTAMFVVCVSLAAVAQDEATNDLSQNAALRYWVAFSQLPADSSDAAQAIDQWEAVEIEVARPHVADFPSALDLLAWANELEACDWGVQRTAGPFALLPHLGPARELTRFSLLRARVRLHDGESEGAVEDALAVMNMGRACNTDLILISSLVDISLESSALGWAASNLSAFDHDALSALREGMSRLPERPTPGLVIQGEEEIILDWFESELKKDEGGFLGGFTEEEMKDFLSWSDVEFDEASMDVQQWIAWIEEARAVYEDAAQIADMPWPDYTEAIVVLEIEIEASDNLVLKLFMPSVGAARSAMDRADVRFAMMQAMISLRLDGEDAGTTIAAMQDPFGDGAFEYIIEELAGEQWVVGLRSVLTRNDEPVELRGDKVIRR